VTAESPLELTMSIPFGDLKAHYEAYQDAIDAAVRRVLSSGWYILGKEVEAFEREFAAYVGARHCIGVGNGTDAIEIALRALGVGPGDEVITVSHTAAFTALGITGAGARPVFVDIDEASYTIDPKAVARAITPRTKAIVPVHLYGSPADLEAIRAVSAGIPVVEDVAQAHGARLSGRILGSIGEIGCFSFYPSKNLGALGDGGAITTNDDRVAECARMVRNGGQRDRYQHVLAGVNSRLDELQAAILRAKLPHLDSMNERRRAIANRYRAGLSGIPDLLLPEPDGPRARSVHHLFVIRTLRRDALRKHLDLAQIGTQIHYPIPAHLQLAFARERTSLPVTERVVGEILSLPIYPELSDGSVDEIVRAIRVFLGEP
jgi:dTDP-4-amino-4,6-dideoxygalactose transaminase